MNTGLRSQITILNLRIERTEEIFLVFEPFINIPHSQEQSIMAMLFVSMASGSFGGDGPIKRVVGRGSCSPMSRRLCGRHGVKMWSGLSWSGYVLGRKVHVSWR